MSILKILDSRPNVTLVFNDMTKDLDGEGNMILILALEAPMDVLGSGRINNTLSGDSIQIGATDVTHVKIHKRTIDMLEEEIQADKAKFEWDEATKKGKLTCDFRLDVSRNEEAWLTKESFANFGRSSRNNRGNDRKNKLADKLRENATRASLAGAAATIANPTPVAGATATS